MKRGKGMKGLDDKSSGMEILNADAFAKINPTIGRFFFREDGTFESRDEVRLSSRDVRMIDTGTAVIGTIRQTYVTESDAFVESAVTAEATSLFMSKFGNLSVGGGGGETGMGVESGSDSSEADDVFESMDAECFALCAHFCVCSNCATKVMETTKMYPICCTQPGVCVCVCVCVCVFLSVCLSVCLGLPCCGFRSCVLCLCHFFGTHKLLE